MANWLTKVLHLSLTGGAVAAAVLVVACASTAAPPSRIVPLRAHPDFHVPDLDVTAVSPEMEQFLEVYVGKIDNLDNRAWKLAWAASDRNILPFRYDPALTLTSVEAFASRRGNCLSFANMLVAMARNQGLKAWYQEVEIPPQWSSTNDTVMVSLHVNVVIHGRHDEWVLDISGENMSTSRKIRRISDTEALAQHYNNLGANALIEGDLGQAYAYYFKAIETAPELPYVWSNLGVVYNRNGQTEDARRAYLQALQIDPGQSTAANNLFAIYQKEGNLDAAHRLQAQVDRYRRKNPYYLYYLSTVAAEQGHYDESTAMLRKAISMYEGEYRFHYELARMEALSGDMDAAQASLHRALELAPDGSPISGATLENLPPLPE